MRILWVKAGKLLPVDTGGKIRTYNILRHLAQSHSVGFISYYPGPKDADYETAIKRELPETVAINIDGADGIGFVQVLQYLRLLFHPAPFAVSNFIHRRVKRVVADWITSGKFDVAVCDFLAASPNFPDVLPIPTILFQHNVETALWQRRGNTESNPLKRIAYKFEARKMEKLERSSLRRFHHIVAVSDHDREQMLAMDSSCAITVVPTGVDTSLYKVAPPAIADPPRIVFLGSMDWQPNVDSVQYFCRSIFPKVRAQFPSAKFQIVGRNPHPSVKQLASDSVEVTGTVPSVTQYLRDATLVVVPLRIGGGTRLKIFEAMATGKAVVSTSIGAEGLAVQNGRDLILADDETAFSDAVILLLRDPNLRRRFEVAASRLAAQYDWSNIVHQFAAVLQKTCRSADLLQKP